MYERVILPPAPFAKTCGNEEFCWSLVRPFCWRLRSKEQVLAKDKFIGCKTCKFTYVHIQKAKLHRLEVVVSKIFIFTPEPGENDPFSTMFFYTWGYGRLR